jgi:hypothetical protein
MAKSSNYFIPGKQFKKDQMETLDQMWKDIALFIHGLFLDLALTFVDAN